MNHRSVPKGFDVDEKARRKVSATQHFTAPMSSPAKKEVIIVKGKGVELGDIPYGLHLF